ncbi:hypothetical protein NLI96_g5352 [Meripilus lineatus]|uniref:Uncharacterized protein n=1 Tax=Meripilus lineatus TaxID=2056292 RepID=A0AAD5V7U5_9APHY|nr:hypothetical protein NLI96_g5352 [Physisporinus lineatus]
MDPSQDPSQDISQDPPQENIPFPRPVAVEPHEILNPIPSSPSSSSSSTSSPPSPLPLPSPPPSPIASSSNADPSSSLVHPQSHVVTHFAQNLLYYLPSPAGQSIRPGSNPDTGFPGEIWQPILEILYERGSVVALLACALTCRYLREPAQSLIDSFFGYTIRTWTYEDIDRIVQCVDDSPGSANLFRKVQFIPKKRGDKSAGSAVALSVAPLRLAGQRALRRVDSLSLGRSMYDPTIEAYFHPRSCPLYGRAFPDTTQIEFNEFQFDSFMEFAFLVTSFPALTSLKLKVVSCRNQVIPPSVARGPKKRNLRLTELEVGGSSMNEKWFAETFLYWLLRRCGRFPENIDFSESLFDHSWGREVLRNCSGSLQKFTIWLDSETRRSRGDFARDSWLSAFEPGSPIAQTVVLGLFEESDISMMKTFISHHMSPAQTLNLGGIQPTAEDFHSFSWKMLDILLFSWYMLYGTRNCRTFSLNLYVPQKLWDGKQAVKEKTTEDEANMWLHSLFPLNMAVGRERWLGYCKAEQGEY